MPRLYAAPVGALVMLGDLPISEGLAVSRLLICKGESRIRRTRTLESQMSLDGLPGASE